jgi:hypothetical protein
MQAWAAGVLEAVVFLFDLSKILEVRTNEKGLTYENKCKEDKSCRVCSKDNNTRTIIQLQNDETVEKVEYFLYLGITISSEGI